jgi:hypothetical protein
VPDDLVLVLTTSSVPEGEIAKSLLEDEGIPVLIKGESEGPYRMGPVHLFVPAGLEVQARLVLAETFEDDAPEAETESETASEGFEDALDEDRGGGGGSGPG